MMSAEVVLLCEDQQIATFVRRFLKRRGFSAHRLRERIAPPGTGSGEQWVRKRFPDEWQAIQRVRSRRRVVLVVGTDADTLSVESRVRSLREECSTRGIPAPALDDTAVLMVIPKRNIETWFAYLRGQEVDGDTVYPRYQTESECKPDVVILDEMCRQGKLRPPFPPSLAAACGEYKKLD